MAADLRRIYSAPTADMAEAELDAFEEKWAGKYASIGVVVACLCKEISMLASRPEPHTGSILP